MIQFQKISKDRFIDDAADLGLELNYEDIIMPKRATSGSAGYDFFALHDFTIKPGEEIKLMTGIKAEFPRLVTLMLFPRSGHGFKNFIRLANTVGIIDSDYYNNKGNEGHIFIKLRNEGSSDFTIKKGTAFAQGVFVPYLQTDEDLYKDENGESTERFGGFGSTNIRYDVLHSDDLGGLMQQQQ